MTFAAQVLHVARKDARIVRWLLAAWFVTLGAMLIAVFQAPAGGQLGMVMTLLVVAVPMLLVGLLVQADSPTRPDAFWVTRPLHPWAVLGAKLLVLAVALLLPALLAQAVAVAAHDAPLAVSWRVLLDSAAMLLHWVLLAAVVAAVTRSVSGLLAGLVLVTLAGSMLVSMLLMAVTADSPDALPGAAWLRPATLLLALALLAWVYRTRNAGRVLIAAVLLGTLLAVAGTALPGGPPRPAAHAEGRATRLDGELRQTGGMTGERYDLAVFGLSPIPTSDTVQVLVVPAAALLRVPGHDDEPVAVSHYSLSYRHFTGHSMPVREHAAAVQQLAVVSLTAAQLERLRQPGAEMVLTGDFVVEHLRKAGVVPLAAGSTIRRDGVRLRLRRVTVAGGDLTIEAVGSAVSSDAPTDLATSRFAWDILSQDAGGPVPLMPRSYSGSPFGLVLPSRYATVGSLRLGAVSGAPGAAPLVLGTGAALRVRSWQVADRFPVEIVATVVDGEHPFP